jgi:hypothetical protein
MRVLGRLFIVLALLLPASFVATLVVTQAASGVSGRAGTAVMKCMHWKDDMRLSPGLTNSPKNQVADAHGRVYGCNKAGGGGAFSATLALPAASCGRYSLQGTGQFDWANGKSSVATLVFEQQNSAPNKFLVSGEITAGLFASLRVHGWLRFSIVETGTEPGALCSSTNPAKKIEFTNSQSLQLFEPDPPPTTLPPVPPPTDPPPPPPGPTPTTAGRRVVIVFPPPTQPPPASPGVQQVVAYPQSPTTGSLAFTGNGIGALIGVEALLIGAALGFFGEDRRRRAARLARARVGPRGWLQITMPPD